MEQLNPDDILVSGKQGDKTVDYDVVIIGGGPAGSTVATLLSQWGRRVLILEKERFPRHHIGESLLPGTATLMRQLGVFEKVEQAGFVHKFGATYIWGKSEEPWTILFAEVTDDARYSFQVDRSIFDEILLDHSAEQGTTVKEECRVSSFVQEEGRIIGVNYIDSEQNTHFVSCHFCVDASGQSSMLGSAFKLRHFNQSLRNIALYNYFKGGKSTVELLPELRPQDKGNIFIVATDMGWIWYIPLSEGYYSVGFVTHVSVAHDLSKENRLKFYLDNVFAVPQLQFLLSDAKMESDTLYTQSDWSYVCSRFYGPGYLLVGDAACFVDPILSTGVDLAMEGAFKAAIAINTSLDNPSTTQSAMKWYEEEYKTKAGHFIQMAEHWYYGHRSKNDWFWKAKSLVDPESNISLQKAFVLLTGGFLNGAGDQDLPALQPFGGFRPFQLRKIYENLDNGFAEGELESEKELVTTGSTRVQQGSSSKKYKESVDDLDEQFLCFQEGLSYRASMLEQENVLVPVIRIEQNVHGTSLTRLVLPPTTLPLLERMDGKQAVHDIKRTLAEEFKVKQEQGSIADYQQLLTSTLHELYNNQLIVAI